MKNKCQRCVFLLFGPGGSERERERERERKRERHQHTSIVMFLVLFLAFGFWFLFLHLKVHGFISFRTRVRLVSFVFPNDDSLKNSTTRKPKENKQSTRLHNQGDCICLMLVSKNRIHVLPMRFVLLSRRSQMARVARRATAWEHIILR